MQKEWLKALDDLTATLKSTLLPPKVIEDAVIELLDRSDSPLGGFYVAARIPPHAEVAVGRQLQGPPPLSDTVSGLAYKGETSFQAWPCGAGGDLRSIRTHCMDFARAFSMDDTRDQRTILPSLQQVPPTRLDATLQYLYPRYGQVAVVFADLDHFGSVNTRFGQAVGDRVVKDVGAVLQSHAGRIASLIHLSGDEFVAVIPATSHEAVLTIAKNQMEATKAHDFELEGMSFSLAMGVVFASSSCGAGWSALQQRAEDAVKPRRDVGKDAKRRDRVTPVLFSGRDGAVPMPRFPAEVAVVVVKSLIEKKEPFANPWLNWLSILSESAAHRSPLAQLELTAELAAFVKWANPIWKADEWACLDVGGALQDCAMSIDDALVAMAHGVLRAALQEEALNFGDHPHSLKNGFCSVIRVRSPSEKG